MQGLHTCCNAMESAVSTGISNGFFKFFYPTEKLLANNNKSKRKKKSEEITSSSQSRFHAHT